DPVVAKTGHDIKRDWLALRRAGADFAGVGFDVMLASFVLDPGKRTHELEAVALEHLRRQPAPAPPRSEKNPTPPAERPGEEVARRTGESVRLIVELKERLQRELDGLALGDLLATIEIPLIGVLVDMESRGIAIDPVRLGELARQFGAELQEIEQQIHHE